MVSNCTSARPTDARVSILLYDTLDFSNDHDGGGGQTRESLSRIALSSAGGAGLDPARFAHQVRRYQQNTPELIAHRACCSRRCSSELCAAMRLTCWRKGSCIRRMS